MYVHCHIVILVQSKTTLAGGILPIWGMVSMFTVDFFHSQKLVSMALRTTAVSVYIYIYMSRLTWRCGPKVRVRRDMCENKGKFDKYTYTYMYIYAQQQLGFNKTMQTVLVIWGRVVGYVFYYGKPLGSQQV